MHQLTCAAVCVLENTAIWLQFLIIAWHYEVTSCDATANQGINCYPPREDKNLPRDWLFLVQDMSFCRITVSCVSEPMILSTYFRMEQPLTKQPDFKQKTVYCFPCLDCFHKKNYHMSIIRHVLTNDDHIMTTKWLNYSSSVFCATRNPEGIANAETPCPSESRFLSRWFLSLL